MARSLQNSLKLVVEIEYLLAVACVDEIEIETGNFFSSFRDAGKRNDKTNDYTYGG
ncbi:MAG: hypothetical protein ACXVBJ_10360 [Flavisolibacter sp.]